MSIFDAKLVEIWGPLHVPLDHALPNAFKPLKEYEPDPENINMQIDFSKYAFPNNRNYQNARQAEQGGFTLRVTRGVAATWQHLRLLELFLSRPTLGSFDQSYNLIAPALFLSSDTAIFSCYDGSNLLGFIAVREVLDNLAIATWATYARTPARVSDFLQYHMIKYYKDSSVRTLDLGYSMYEGLLVYKRRWGANMSNGGYWDQSFALRDYQPVGRHWHWWIRETVTSNHGGLSDENHDGTKQCSIPDPDGI